jgi:16S rRNA (guanine527-N7)-methyltransferase
VSHTPESRLRAGVEKMSLSLPEGAMEKLMAYLALLVKWNGAYNLTAIRDPEQMAIKHLLDSLSIVPHVQGRSLIDVGHWCGLAWVGTGDS